MTMRFLPAPRFANLLAVIEVVLMLVPGAMAERLSLERAIRLALSHSTTSAIADADVQQKHAAYQELRDSQIPQVVSGSGLGRSYGIPLTIEGSAPAIGNVSAQSTVINFAQSQSLGAARADIRAAELQKKDLRNAVIQDVALSYAELDKWETRLTHLEQDETQAQKMVQAIAARVREGIDSNVDVNQARLVLARVHLHQTEARGSADVLRYHLFTLTGLLVSAIEISPGSVPPLPPLPSDDDLENKAVAESLTVKIADQHALGDAMRASAEHRASLPSLDFSAQYALLSSAINNYGTYYIRYQANNATIGGALHLPLFNATQRAHAQGAGFEALKSKGQAEATRDKVSEETLKLERTAEQLDVARAVAQLEYEAAQNRLEATRIRVDAELGTLHELADAQVQVSERYLDYQDADFEYLRGRMILLRSTGDLEKWAVSTSSLK